MSKDAVSAPYEVTLGQWRSEGMSKINSIVLLHERHGIPVGEGKRIVHLSEAWADRREIDDAWVDELIEIADALPKT